MLIIENEMYLYYNKRLKVTAISDTPIDCGESKYKKVCPTCAPESLIGKRLPGSLLMMEDFETKEYSELRVAIICNWNDQCGISTYSGYLVNALKPQVADLKVFSEITPHVTGEDEPFVDRCWQRGKNLLELADRVLAWSPDFIIIQHEFGIFPNAFYFMQLMQAFSSIPHAVVMHSVYEHLDKVVYTEGIRNIICHSEAGKECLRRNGNTANVNVIPHGCISVDDSSELWNICVSPYTIMQFGFGFSYKGVEDAIRAVSILVNRDDKFSDMQYLYLCSENSFNSSVHDSYHDELSALIEELGVEKNVCILRKYQTERMLHLFLRLAKIAIFPYKTDPENVVYGASGAIRVAMANERPVIASSSHMFDDLEGIVPRPSSPEELAAEIDEIFSNGQYREDLVEKSKKYVSATAWSKIANQYLNVYNKFIEQAGEKTSE